MIYTISHYYEDTKCNSINFEEEEYTNIVLICSNDPRKQKIIEVPKERFNADQYPIGRSYSITKFFCWEKWSWCKP